MFKFGLIYIIIFNIILKWINKLYEILKSEI